MKQRALETIFSHKILILLPVLIIVPLAIVFALRPKPAQWQAWSTIWVDQYRPLFDQNDISYTPANSQAQLLGDFLHTRTFALAVVQSTDLKDRVTSPDSEDQEIASIWTAIDVWPQSNNFITLRVTMPTPELAYQVAKATLDQYQQSLRDRMQEQSTVALSVYADTVTKAETRVGNSRAALAQYLAAHPELSKGRPESDISIESQDPTLARLSNQVNTDQDAYRYAVSRYDNLQISVAAGAQGQQLAFRVVDEPRLPRVSVGHGRMSLIAIPGFGLVMALLVSTVIAVFLVVTNRAVLGAQDVRGALNLFVLSEIPDLPRKRRFWQRASRDAVRLRLIQPAKAPPSDVRSA